MNTDKMMMSAFVLLLIQLAIIYLDFFLFLPIFFLLFNFCPSHVSSLLYLYLVLSLWLAHEKEHSPEAWRSIHFNIYKCTSNIHLKDGRKYEYIMEHFLCFQVHSPSALRVMTFWFLSSKISFTCPWDWCSVRYRLVGEDIWLLLLHSVSEGHLNYYVYQ